MADTIIAYDEIRFDVRDEQLTHVYVFIKNVSNDGMLGVQGWHHKVFPARMSTLDIMKAWNEAGPDWEDPLLWPLNAPPN